MTRTLAELERYAGELAATPELWAHHVRHGCEDRVYEQIVLRAGAQRVGDPGQPGSRHGFHDHDTSAARIA